MSSKSLMFAVTIVLSGACSSAGAAGLFDVYQDAVASDAQYAAARSQYAAAEQRLPQATAALLPSLSVSGNALKNDNDSNTMYGDGQYDSYEYSANLTQPLFRMGALITRDQSKQALRQAGAELDLARQDLILRVSQAYFDVLLAQDNLRTVQDQRAAYGEQATSANRKFQLGTASITDVRDTQARAQLAVAQEIAAKVDVQAKRDALAVLLSKDPGALEELKPGTALAMPSDGNLAGFVDAARAQSKTVLAGEAAVEVADREVRKVQSSHLPTIDAIASYGRSESATTSTVGTTLEGATYGLQFNLPIYSGGSVMAREREAKALLDKANADLEGARRQSALEAQQAYLSATAGMSQVAALEEAVRSAQAALDANKRGLELGVRVDIDVLNAQQQLSATQRDLAKARYDTLMALLKLRRATGKLGEDDVKQMAAYFGK